MCDSLGEADEVQKRGDTPLGFEADRGVMSGPLSASAFRPVCDCNTPVKG